jgi:hypothetical protein
MRVSEFYMVQPIVRLVVKELQVNALLRITEEGNFINTRSPV